MYKPKEKNENKLKTYLDKQKDEKLNKGKRGRTRTK